MRNIRFCFSAFSALHAKVTDNSLSQKTAHLMSHLRKQPASYTESQDFMAMFCQSQGKSIQRLPVARDKATSSDNTEQFSIY